MVTAALQWNIVSSGPALLRRPPFSKSNIELLDALRSNFAAWRARQPHKPDADEAARPTAQVADSGAAAAAWTRQDGDTLYVPAWEPKPLAEPREAYDITAKLFYLPGVPSTRRCRHTGEAIDLVLKELGVDSIDLLIVSYPGVSFDADDETADDETGSRSRSRSRSPASDESEGGGLDAQIQTWQVLESLHARGTIKQLGLSEFSSERLQKFLPEVGTKPAVDQINIRDCCVVPKSLIVFAKAHDIELLTHADCTDILPPGTLRELLRAGGNEAPGEEGAGLLAARADAAASEQGLKGDIEPQWVIKYTAVVRNRGVIENKGYFAVAQLGSCIEA